jgi:thymidine kinase
VDKQIKVCEVCGERPATETHHIKEQHEATKGRDKTVHGSIRLNAVSNLVGICERCHDAHHQKKITIHGW